MRKDYVKDEANQDNAFLTTAAEGQETALASLTMLRRHQAGNRGKMATAFTAGVRKRFAQHTLPTAFLEADAIKAARASYKLHRKEFRAKKDRGPECSVKLPLCESIRVSLKKRLWTGWS